MTTLIGRRVTLRPLVAEDFAAWQEVRRRNTAWLTKWEPKRNPAAPDPVESPHAFALRCEARQRERQLGSGFGFGIFLGRCFIGEMNLSAVQRGPFQNAYVGYWIDEARAGQGYVPEAIVVLCGFAFEELRLHRLQISIVPRNHASRRVMEKLGIRDEGVALRYLEIDGVWEDHIRFALTAEEWHERRDELMAAWVA